MPDWRPAGVSSAYRKPRVALIVPMLNEGGGVPAVARFIKDIIISSGKYDLKLLSLRFSASDQCSVALRRPRSWRSGITTCAGMWEGLPYTDIGGFLTEFEFQRYRPRQILSQAIADCDIIQVVCGSPAVANAVCGYGKPVAVQCATLAVVERRMRDGQPTSLLCWWRKAMTAVTGRMDDHALRSVDAIQVENAWMYEYARQLNRGREVDLRYAPPGLDAHTLCPAPNRHFERDPYVLCVGRMPDPRKNIRLLLEAYAVLPDDVRMRLRLVLAGLAGPPDDFWRRAEALGLRGRIEFIHNPSSNELVALYQKASMFVLPSDEEGLGVVLLEAMACGIPVVSTRSGGPDSIITEGEDGYLVPLDDVAALADRIARLHRDGALNRAIGQRARATIQHRYAEEVARQPFLDVWENLLRKAKMSKICAE